ncbi:MAG: hypothetical protein JO332_12810 [Planctomycetaceae bacterium]|nr:hypothetical protein [Planctomycetaceae bacterium]
MMSFGPEPDPPFFRFFLRAETMAASAFRTIPYVGDGIAEFFLNSVVPYCTPKRDRVLFALLRRFKTIEGGIHLLIMRLIPLR